MKLLLRFIIRYLIPYCGLAGVIFFGLFVLNINAFIRNQALATFKTQFPGATIHLDSAEFIQHRGVRIRGLRIQFPEKAFLENAAFPVKKTDLILPKSKNGVYKFLSVEELFIVAPVSWEELATKGLEIKQVQLRNADVYLYPISSERWNFQYLRLGGKKNHTAFQEIVLKEVDFHINDYRKNNGRDTYELRDFVAKMVLKTTNEYDVVGKMCGDYAQSIGFKGIVNLDKKKIDIQGHLENCELSNRLFNSLPEECLPQNALTKKIEDLHLIKDISGQLSLKYDISYDGSQILGRHFTYKIEGNITNGRETWEGIPYPITNIEIEFKASESNIDIKSFSSKIGDGSINLSYQQWGYTPNAKKDLKIQIRNIELTDKFVNLDPKKLEPLWSMVKPAGVINADIQFQFDGNQWIPFVNLDCDKGEITYKNFPFHLTNLSGNIRWENQTLKAILSDNSNITVQAQFFFPLATENSDTNKTLVTQPKKKFRGSVLVSGKNVLVNEKLSKACPKVAEDLINQFDPKGAVNIEFGITFTGDETPPHLSLDIDLINCSGRYENFPYPLQNVNGQIKMRDNFWTYNNITVNTKPVVAVASGSVELRPDKPHDFFLNLDISDLPADKLLSSSMPEDSAKLLEGIGDAGSFNAQVEISMRLGVDKTIKMKIHADPIGDTVSLRSMSFPYRLERVSGSIEYENNHFSVKDFKAYHGQTLIISQVDGDILHNHGWTTRLTKVAIDRLEIDRDLLNAMPETSRKAIGSLNISGLIHFRGDVTMNYNRNSSEPISAQWNGEIGVQEVSINKGIAFRGICGGITTSGYMQNQNFYSEGWLNLDSLLWETMQFSNIKGPYQINNYQLFLGGGAPEVLSKVYPTAKNTFTRPMKNGPDHKPQSIASRIYGGDFYSDIVVLFNDKPQFAIFAALLNARLEQCGELTQSEKLQGQIELSLNMWGTSGDMNSLGGKGILLLKEADIYQLPTMISMLKLLSVRPPSTNAFSNVEAMFRIAGPHLFFDRIDLRGDAISLYGSGEMDFNKHVHMSFFPLMGKGDYYIPVLRDVFRGVSKNMMSIRIEGNPNNLKIWRESPLVNEFRQPDSGKAIKEK